MTQENFDDSIKRKADNHQAMVPADAWDNITKKKKKRRYPVFWWSLSSLLVIGILFIYIHSNKTSNNVLATNKVNTRDRSISQPAMSAHIDSERISLTTKNVEQLKTQQQNNTSSNELSKSITDSKSSIQNNTATQPSNEQILQIKPSSSTTNKNTLATAGYSSIKKHRYSQKAKFKNTGIDALIDSETVNKATINDINNDFVIKDRDSKNNSNSDSIHKNDSNNVTSIPGKQKKLTVDSTTKVKEADIGSTKKTTQTKMAINAGKKISPALILDFSIIPFSSIQHYDQVLSVTRTTDNNNIHSVYSATSIQTSLQSSVAFALGIRKSISKKIMIGTGIQYSQIKETIKLSGVQTDTKYTAVQRLATNSTGPYLMNDTIATTTTGTRVINAVNSYQLYSIPLFIDYTFITHNIFSIGFTGGIYFIFSKYNNSIDGKLQSIYSYGTQADNEKNNLAIDIFGGLRLSWFVSKKYQLFTEPNFRYNLSKYELKNSFINKNINQAGVSVGISYKIK